MCCSSTPRQRAWCRVAPGSLPLRAVRSPPHRIPTACRAVRQWRHRSPRGSGELRADHAAPSRGWDVGVRLLGRRELLALHGEPMSPLHCRGEVCNSTSNHGTQHRCSLAQSGDRQTALPRPHRSGTVPMFVKRHTKILPSTRPRRHRLAGAFDCAMAVGGAVPRTPYAL